jgi:hypothetical protein
MNKAAKNLKRKRERINWKNSPGMRFGRWVALEVLSSDRHGHVILCRCDNNKDTNVYISYQGLTKTRSQWARLLGITNLALRARFRRGQSVEQAFKGMDFPQKQKP